MTTTLQDELAAVGEAWDRLVLALRKAAAKDLRVVARLLTRTANRLDPPPLLRLVRDLGRLLPKTPPVGVPGLGQAILEAQDQELRRRAKECGQIIYATGPGWGQVSHRGGTCRLPRHHDGDHVPT